jgi:hypothetical protein
MRGECGAEGALSLFNGGSDPKLVEEFTRVRIDAL